MRTTINVEGMKCEGCEESIKNALTAMEGVKRVDADHREGTVVVEYDGIDLKSIEDRINSLGYRTK